MPSKGKSWAVADANHPMPRVWVVLRGCKVFISCDAAACVA